MLNLNNIFSKSTETGRRRNAKREKNQENVAEIPGLHRKEKLENVLQNPSWVLSLL